MIGASLLGRVRRERPPDGGAMTLAEHIAELRRRVIVSLVAVAVGAAMGWVLYHPLFEFLRYPYCRAVGHHACLLYATQPLTGLSLRIKVSTYAGLFFASPVVLFELWRFITPGLHARERRYALPFVAASLVLFLGGAALAYVSFAHALEFLGSIGGPGLRQLYDPNSYLGLLLAFMVLFGLTFEFPAVLVGLELAGVLSWRTLAAKRRWAIFGIVVGAAVLTPSGDPFSMLALAVPLVVFYEISILLGRLLRR
jgi:sec-independent protein translocase protein TatC